MSKLFRSLLHSYFDQKKESHVPAQAGKFAQWIVRIIQPCCTGRNWYDFIYLAYCRFIVCYFAASSSSSSSFSSHCSLLTLLGFSFLFCLFCLVFVYIVVILFIVCYLSRWIKLFKIGPTLRVWSKHAKNKYNMADGRYFKKSKNRRISARVGPIGTKFFKSTP